MNWFRRSCLLLMFIALGSYSLQGQGKRKVIIDQDASGPGGSDMQAILSIVNSPETEVLGITILTGDAWRDEEVQHALRLMEIVGRRDIPVVPGAVFPLVNSKEFIEKWQTLYGKWFTWVRGTFLQAKSTDLMRFPRCRKASPLQRL